MIGRCVSTARGWSQSTLFFWTTNYDVDWRVCRIWSHNRVWASWMHKKYVDNLPFAQINPQYDDSLDWRSFLRHGLEIGKCFDDTPNRSLRCTGLGECLSLLNVWHAQVLHWKGRSIVAVKIWIQSTHYARYTTNRLTTFFMNAIDHSDWSRKSSRQKEV